MSLDIVIGGMGAGKSYFCAKVAMDALNQGRVVCTNIPLNAVDYPNLYKFDWSSLKCFNDEQIAADYPYLTMKGVLFILDEAWAGIPSGDRNLSSNLRLMSFFREHRQMVNEQGISNDIIIITQNSKSINTSIRELADRTILCIKPRSAGLNNVTVRYYIDGFWDSLRPPSGAKRDLILRAESAFLKPEIFAFYNSYVKSADSGTKGGYDKEGTAIKQPTVFQSWKFRIGLTVGVLCMINFISNFGTIFNPKAAQAQTPIQTTQAHNDDHAVSMQNATPSKTPEAQKPVEEKKPPEEKKPEQPEKTDKDNKSKTWRIASIVTNKKTGNLFIYAVDTKGHYQRLDDKTCKKADFNQWYCMLDNQIVTQYTGAYLAKEDTQTALANVFK